MVSRKLLGILILIALSMFSWLIPYWHLMNVYYQQLLITIGINIILTLSLNLVNGYMGEFSLGHAGFMAIGAYIASLLSLYCLPASFFIVATIAGGLGAAIFGIVIALLSFKTRGDYLAILTLAFLMIVQSILENLTVIGGASGLSGIPKLTHLTDIFFWLLICLYLFRNLINSPFGRAMLAIREDEIAAKMMGVDIQKTKIIAFGVSAFFTGVAGALYAHLLQFINPSMFGLSQATDMLIMVYLGGAGSITGSILGSTTYTVLLEVLRPLAEWRMILMPILLVFLMLYRPNGMMGFREWPIFKYQAKLNK